jgi:hypothetical protein
MSASSNNNDKKQNCWEVKKCGRQPGGNKVGDSGVCPASIPGQYDGKNGGSFSGRFCWAVAGTLCQGKPEASDALNLRSCFRCSFMKQVAEEEGDDFVL